MRQVLTANRLDFGDVVYWSAALGWVTDLVAADMLNDADAESALAHATESVARREVVGPYLFDVRDVDGTIAPLKEREIIRAAGPTVRTDLGKQSDVPLR